MNWFWRCSECGCIWENGQYCDACEDEEIEYDEEEVSEEDLIYCMRDIYWDGISLFTEYQLRQSLEGPCFNAYRKALKPITSGVEEEVENCLEQLEEMGDTLEEKLLWIGWANHVQHVHGNILEDYGYFDNGLVDRVSQEGIESVLEIEEMAT